jgi:hypothetical protein
MPPPQVIGALAGNCEFATTHATDAWLVQLDVLARSSRCQGNILLEFSIPRIMAHRHVLLVRPDRVAIGPKVTRQRSIAPHTNKSGIALDLKNFHEASHAAAIVPILLATEAPSTPVIDVHADPDQVYQPIKIGPDDLRDVIDHCVARISGQDIDADAWRRSSYRPTPTIIEAARALYAHHSVEAIARFDAGADNLRLTSYTTSCRPRHGRARENHHFVTGVPGAGKTLVGLNVATRHRRKEDLTHAVFLSGNGPLVAVLSEALTRDEVERRKRDGQDVRKGAVRESIKAFIQNVHHFRDTSLSDGKPPPEHVVIFDEAQRAWNLRQTANFMKRKKKRPGFSQSEPEFLISVLDRHSDWAVIICLVGGGQEINMGEAGITAWLDAILQHFPLATLHFSRLMTASMTRARRSTGCHLDNARFDDSLHLAVSMRL